LRRQQSEQADNTQSDALQTISLNLLAARLATTEVIVSHGLVLLEKLGLLETRLVMEKSASEKGRQAAIRLLPTKGAGLVDLTDRLEFVLFSQSLRETARFRGWLLKSPLATIKSVLKPSGGVVDVSFPDLDAFKPEIFPETVLSN